MAQTPITPSSLVPPHRFQNPDELEYALASSANATALERALAIVLNEPSSSFSGTTNHLLVIEALQTAIRIDAVLKEKLKQEQCHAKAA